MACSPRQAISAGASHESPYAPCRRNGFARSWPFSSICHQRHTVYIDIVGEKNAKRRRSPSSVRIAHVEEPSLPCQSPRR